MLHRKAQLARFVAVTGVLVLWSTHAASRFEGDTIGEPGSNIDACTAKLVYEALLAAAQDADKKYKAIPEPDWSTLSGDADKAANDLRDEGDLEEYLNDLKREVAQARSLRAKAGNHDAELILRRHQELVNRYNAMQPRVTARQSVIKGLDEDIKKLMGEIEKLDGTGDAKKPDAQKQAQIADRRRVIAATQTKIAELVGTPDMDEAQKRVTDPKFKDFSSTEIKQARENLKSDEILSRNAKEAAERKLAEAIEDARKQTAQALALHVKASRELTRLENSDDVSGDDDVRLAQKAEKQEQLQRILADKAKLATEKPTEQEFTDVKARMEALGVQVDAIKTLRTAEPNLKKVEAWINARLARNKTEQRLKDAEPDYYKAIQFKDSRLNEARQQFNELQGWMNTQRAGLQGREKDEQYWKTIAEIKTRGRASYMLMEADLSSLECFPPVKNFPDVKNFLDDIRARRKKIEAIQIGTPVKKPPTRIARKPPVKKPPVKKPAPAGGVVWVRKAPVFASANTRGRMPKYLSVSATSLTYTTTRDGKTYTNTLTWTEPPAKIRQGETVQLTMSATTQEGASVGGWYNLRNVSDIKGHNGAGSLPHHRSESPHSGTVTFKATSLPRIEVSAGHDPAPDTWVVITWDYALAK